jgi:glutathione S-transferase
MPKLTHYRLCPFSRSIRLALTELGIEVDLVEERLWEWRPEFLALNPSGELPVLEFEGGPLLCGAYAISEYIAEEANRHAADHRAIALFPGNGEERAEVRRLVDWFHGKFDREVTRELLVEKVYRGTSAHPAVGPAADVMRAIRANLRYHMSYIGYLADQRRWLAGEELSFADLAAAAHLSSVDYLGEAPWEQYPVAKLWYARVKSRPSFRSILADRIPGTPPPLHYTALDF